MNLKEYNKLARRTECDQRAALNRMAGGASHSTILSSVVGRNHPLIQIRFNHALIGMMNELGELAKVFQKWVYYGGTIDVPNVGEEAGDLLWYWTQLLDSMGLDPMAVLDANIAKLKARYPDKYTQENALNRDAAAERAVLDNHGFGAPPLGCEEGYHEWIHGTMNDELVFACRRCGETKGSAEAE